MKLRKLKHSALMLALTAGLAPAHAAVFAETEPNDTLATAQVISDPGSLQTVINGARTFLDPSDDFFRFMVDHNALAVAEPVFNHPRADLDFKHLSAIGQGKAEQRIAFRRTARPE